MSRHPPRRRRGSPSEEPARGAPGRAPRAHRPLRRRLVPLCGDVGQSPARCSVTVLSAVREPGRRGRHRHPGRAATGSDRRRARRRRRRCCSAGTWRLVGRGPGAERPFLLGRARGPGHQTRAGLVAVLPREPAGSPRPPGWCAPGRRVRRAVRPVPVWPARARRAARRLAVSGADPGLRRWLGQVDGRGGCAHPDGVVRLVRSALQRSAPRLRSTPEAGAPACGPTSCLFRSAIAGGPGPAAGELHRLRRPGPVRRGPARADNPRRLGTPTSATGTCRPGCWATRARPSGRVPKLALRLRRAAVRPVAWSPCRRDSFGRPGRSAKPQRHQAAARYGPADGQRARLRPRRGGGRCPGRDRWIRRFSRPRMVGSASPKPGPSSAITSQAPPPAWQRPQASGGALGSVREYVFQQVVDAGGQVIRCDEDRHGLPRTRRSSGSPGLPRAATRTRPVRRPRGPRRR